jgi:hypothetical protein
MSRGLLLTCVIAMLVGCRVTAPSVQQLDLARDTTLGEEWTVLELAQPLPVAHPRSQLFVEVPTLSDDATTAEIHLTDGEVLRMEASVASATGEWMELEVLYSVAFSKRRFVVASSKQLRSGVPPER